MTGNQGDMSALRDLIGRVTEGCRVKITNHDYCMSSGEATVTRVYTAPAQTYRHEGETRVIREGGPAYRCSRTGARRGEEMYYQFPVEGEDFAVEGNTLRVYRPADPRIGKRRVIALTLTYFPVES